MVCTCLLSAVVSLSCDCIFASIRSLTCILCRPFTLFLSLHRCFSTATIRQSSCHISSVIDLTWSAEYSRVKCDHGGYTRVVSSLIDYTRSSVTWPLLSGLVRPWRLLSCRVLSVIDLAWSAEYSCVKCDHGGYTRVAFQV